MYGVRGEGVDTRSKWTRSSPHLHQCIRHALKDGEDQKHWQNMEALINNSKAFESQSQASKPPSTHNHHEIPYLRLCSFISTCGRRSACRLIRV